MDPLLELKRMLEAELRRFGGSIAVLDLKNYVLEIDLDPDTPENRAGASKLIADFLRGYEDLTDDNKRSINECFDGVLNLIKEL